VSAQPWRSRHRRPRWPRPVRPRRASRRARRAGPRPPRSDLGCHIDGFIATQAQTIVVAADFEAPVSGKAADVIAAARTCFDAAIRLIRPGKHVADVAKTLEAIAEVYGCSLVEGVMSHQMKQFTIDANKCVLNKVTPEQRVENEEFEENEVYAIDIVVSTGARSCARPCAGAAGACRRSGGRARGC
jgi:methionine aminopeptidase